MLQIPWIIQKIEIAINARQTTNPISQKLRPSTSYLVPKVQIITKGITYQKTPTWPPHIMSICQPLPTINPIIWNSFVLEQPTQKIQVNDFSLSMHPTNCIDNFIDRLAEVEETDQPERDPVSIVRVQVQIPSRYGTF